MKLIIGAFTLIVMMAFASGVIQFNPPDLGRANASPLNAATTVPTSTKAPTATKVPTKAPNDLPISEMELLPLSYADEATMSYLEGVCGLRNNTLIPRQERWDAVQIALDNGCSYKGPSLEELQKFNLMKVEILNAAAALALKPKAQSAAPAAVAKQDKPQVIVVQGSTAPAAGPLNVDNSNNNNTAKADQPQVIVIQGPAAPAAGPLIIDNSNTTTITGGAGPIQPPVLVFNNVEEVAREAYRGVTTGLHTEPDWCYVRVWYISYCATNGLPIDANLLAELTRLCNEQLGKTATPVSPGSTAVPTSVPATPVPTSAPPTPPVAPTAVPTTAPTPGSPSYCARWMQDMQIPVGALGHDGSSKEQIRAALNQMSLQVPTKGGGYNDDPSKAMVVVGPAIIGIDTRGMTLEGAIGVAIVSDGRVNLYYQGHENGTRTNAGWGLFGVPEGVTIYVPYADEEDQRYGGVWLAMCENPPHL